LLATRIGASFLSYLGPIGRFQPLRGYFSAYQLLKKKKISGAILKERQSTRADIAASINERAGYNQHAPEAWPIFWTLSENSRLTGQYLLWRDYESKGCLEASYGFTKRMNIRSQRFFDNAYLDKPEKLSGAVTSLLTNWTSGNNYYHWIIDALPRLAIRESLPETTRIIIPNSSMRFVQESISLLGLEDLCIIPTSNHLICERFYFISPTAQTGHWNPFAYDWLRRKFSTYFSSSSSISRLFFTRKGCKRIPNNIGEIEALFERNGFYIVDAGKLTMIEQIALSSSARCIAGLHGAAMTNLIWSKKQIPILEIFESTYLNACYENIAVYNECYYHYIFCDISDAQHHITQWISELPP
jgi:hypothetical protein